MPLYDKMLQELGPDMLSLNALNTPNTYADSGVKYMAAALLGFRIDIYSGDDLETRIQTFNKTTD